MLLSVMAGVGKKNIVNVCNIYRTK